MTAGHYKRASDEIVEKISTEKKRPRARRHARTFEERCAERVYANCREEFSRAYLLPGVDADVAEAAAACWSRLRTYFFPAKNTDVIEVEPSPSFLVA